MPLPVDIPLIVLAECNVFPHALLPLNIFEPRYRAMLDHALAHDRFFAVGTLKRAEEDEWSEADENIDDFSCAGLIRACVGQPDGTSRLILQGVRRIRFVDWVQREPFRIARIERVPSLVRSAPCACELARRLLGAARSTLPDETPLTDQFDKQFGPLHDPEIVADVIGYNFLPRATDRQPLLGMRVVEDRLDYVLEKLSRLPTE